MAHRRRKYQADHHALQAVLASELQEYGPHPLEPKDAEMVAWRLADVTLGILIQAVERETVGHTSPASETSQ
jgi:hypothetical protein